MAMNLLTIRIFNDILSEDDSLCSLQDTNELILAQTSSQMKANALRNKELFNDASKG